jgi:Xaa-Pro aminopeptidase
VLLVEAGRSTLLTDGRYEFSVREGLRAGTLAPVEFARVDGRYDQALTALINARGLRRAGFEAAHVTMALLRAWQRGGPDVDWVATDSRVERLRMVKDADELSILRDAGQRLASVARRLPTIVRRDRTEIEVAKDIESAMLDEGFSGPAFPTIVASGPNSAHPHARPTGRRLTLGDLVVLDFGGVLDGYCVDLTRMAAVGEVPPAAHDLYRAVRDAQAAAVAVVRPGIETSAVDTAARAVLEARGLGNAFLHATGHGLGLEVHEAPRIARPDPDVTERLVPGIVFTIEPGAYVEGVGGVRLEDDVLVTAEGSDVLTPAPRDLLVV